MSLDVYNPTRPGIRNQQSTANTDPTANLMEEFVGVVEGEIARRSVLQGWINVRSSKSGLLTSYGTGGTSIQVVQPGVTPDGSKADFSKVSLRVDTLLLARNIIPLLEDFQSSFDVRKELGQLHGKKFSKFIDQAFFIQAAKAALMTTNPYGSDGMLGGTTETLGAGESATDPAVIYARIANLLAKMEDKDVDPQNDDLMIAVRPDIFYALIQSEQVVNGEYITADGNRMKGYIFSAFGVPVIRSNNVPNSVITGHELSNAQNGNAYNGDFTKLVALAFSPRALLAGESIALRSKQYYDDITVAHYVDTLSSFAVTPNRPEYAGAILLP